MRRLMPWAVLLCLGCLSKAPLVRSPKPERVVTAFVFDPETQPRVSDVSILLKKEVEKELSARNLQMQEAPLEKFATSWNTMKDSKLRFDVLRKSAQQQGAYVLLVETRASFFSQLNGRYRYLVSFRLTGGRADGLGEVIQWSFDQPTYTNFDNEREWDAVETARGHISSKAGQVLDSLLLSLSAGMLPQTQRTRLPGPMYFIMVDRFWNADPRNDGDANKDDPAAFHGGDLKGVISQLDRLQAMGIKTVWLSPVFKMRTQKFFEHGAFHGYWVEDLSQVEPRFGTTQLLETLSQELRRRDMGLVLDMVFNHVAPDSKWLKEKPHWFHRQGAIQDWNNVDQLTTRDVHGLPDLAVETEEVYRYLMDTSLRWVRLLKPVGLRMDAVKHIPLSFWARFNQEIRAQVDYPFVILGEMYDGSPSVQSQIQRAGKFDAMFDFPLYFAMVDVFCRGTSASRLASIVSQDRAYDSPLSLVTFADNHDLPRIMSDCSNKTDQVAQLLTFQMLSRGTPNLTYGTEFGAEGRHEPYNRGDWMTNDSTLRQHVTQLLAIRSKHRVFQDGPMWVHSASPQWIILARAVENEIAVIAVSSSRLAAQVPFPTEFQPGEAVDPFTEKALSRPVFTLLPNSVRAFTVKVDTDRWLKLAQERQKGERKRRVEFLIQHAALVGAGAELGDWTLSKALLPDERGVVSVEIPAGTMTEMKLVHKNRNQQFEFEAGKNRFVFVPPGEELMKVEFTEEAGSQG